MLRTTDFSTLVQGMVDGLYDYKWIDLEAQGLLVSIWEPFVGVQWRCNMKSLCCRKEIHSNSHLEHLEGHGSFHKGIKLVELQM